MEWIVSIGLAVAAILFLVGLNREGAPVQNGNGRRRKNPFDRAACAFERIADVLQEAVCILGRIEEKVGSPVDPPDDDPDALRKLEERVEKAKQSIAAGRVSLDDAVDRNKPPA